ncbi:MAG TPA: ABC transporter permease [Streptosporangiaceae bacterium]|jgi:ABC-2 type transport system permease protein
MNPAITMATVRRILSQIRHDHRTLALIIFVPSVLMVLLYYVIDNQLVFDRWAPMLLGLFPFIAMFLVTSIATLRERTSGTLERLMTMPLGKLDLLLGYGIAFGLTALIQVGLVLTIAMTWLGLDLAGSVAVLTLAALLNALLGVALGLFASAFSRTEFQAVQMMPALVLPQLLLSGLLVPRDQMTTVLEWLSNVMPLSYAIEAMQKVTTSAAATAALWRDIAVIGGCVLLALVLAAATLRRRTA